MTAPTGFVVAIAWRALAVVAALTTACSTASTARDPHPGATSRPTTGAAASLPFYTTADLTPTWLAPGADPVHRISPFTFVDQSGTRIGSADLDGKVYVASFFFTSCRGICPRMVGNLLRVQAAYADNPNVVLISHTVTPDIDTVAALARYGKEKGIDAERWHLVTGDKGTIYAAARASYFADAGGDADAFLHTETVYLVDGDRRIRGLYNGLLPLDIDRLIEDIAILEAAG